MLYCHLNDTTESSFLGDGQGGSVANHDITEIRWAGDPYCITRAAAKVADGENVIFKILRNGEVMDLELHQ